MANPVICHMSHARLLSVPEVLKLALNTTLNTNNRLVTLLRLEGCDYQHSSVFSGTVSVSVSGRLPSVQSVCASVHQFICAAKCESDSSSHTALCFCDTSYAKCSPARSRSARPV